MNSILIGALTGRLASRYSATGQTNRLKWNLDGRALIGRSKTALNSAVVRSCHSRPAPFRCRFQNARPVLGNLLMDASIWGVQSNGIFDGFPELESWSFCLDTIPLLKNKAASRATSAQFPRSVRRGVRRSVRRIIRATSGNLSEHQPGSIRLASGQQTGNVRADAGECPARWPQPRPVHDQSAVSPWPRNFRAASGVASGAVSAESSAQHPVNNPGNYRATAKRCPSSWRNLSQKTPMNVRTMVGERVCRWLGSFRWSSSRRSRSR